MAIFHLYFALCVFFVYSSLIYYWVTYFLSANSYINITVAVVQKHISMSKMAI